MTCIAVVKHEDKIYMAGDRGASDDGTILALDAPKVWKIGPYLIGYAGSMDGERIRYNFKPSAPNIKDLFISLLGIVISLFGSSFNVTSI